MGWGSEYMELYVLFIQLFCRPKTVVKIKTLLYFENQVDDFLSLTSNPHSLHGHSVLFVRFENTQHLSVTQPLSRWRDSGTWFVWNLAETWLPFQKVASPIAS